MRFWTSTVVMMAWIAFFTVWLTEWAPGTYLALIMSWALIPVLIQVAFGADILWHKRKLIAAATAIPTVYFWMLDFVAMEGGTWTLDPVQTLGVKLFGVLPLEEMVFFLMTNLLITFGVTLVLSPQGQERASRLVDCLRPLCIRRKEN
jgi:putative membrane protein